ncbi:TPA: hypothetical protein DEP96_04260 [Candidatus Uhrbacteria bacterium]|nr:hypothetical protein [Candidatus Uhrbacteria bacterium]
MNTQVKDLPRASTMPNLIDLWRDLVQTVKNWRQDRAFAALDFHEMREDEITDEIREAIEEARKAPREDLINIQ